MKIGNTDYAVGQTVPADVVAKAAPKFYAAAEAQRKDPFARTTRDLEEPFTMLGLVLSHTGPYDYEAEQKRLKAAAKKGEILVFGDKYLANKKLAGHYFVAKCNGLARKRHPEADEALRIQDAEYSYNAECTTLFTRELM